MSQLEEFPKFFIYKITLESGKTYIGQHTQKSQKDNYISSSTYIHRHPEDKIIKRENILQLKDKEELNIFETICILQDIAENGKNNVNGTLGGWCLKYNYEMTEAIRQKIREKLTGTHRPENVKQKISKSNRGKPKSESHRKHISESLIGKPSWNKGIKTGPLKVKREIGNCKGLKWFNNGIKNKRAKECPPGFVEGYLKLS